MSLHDPDSVGYLSKACSRSYRRTVSVHKKLAYPLKTRTHRPIGAHVGDATLPKIQISIPDSLYQSLDDLKYLASICTRHSYRSENFDALVLFCSMLYRLGLNSRHGKATKPEYHEIPAAYLKEIFGENYITMIDLGVELGVIKRDNSYIKDVKCMGYLLCGEYSKGGIVRITPRNQHQVARERQLKEARVEKDSGTRETMKAVRRISISSEAYQTCLDHRNKKLLEITQRYQELLLKRKNFKKEVWIDELGDYFQVEAFSEQDLLKSRQEEYDQAEVEYQSHVLQVDRIRDQDFFVVRDPFIRIHHNVVNLWREIRKCLYVKGKPKYQLTIDIANSQPRLLAVLMNEFARGKYNDEVERQRLVKDMVYCATHGDSRLDISQNGIALDEEFATKIFSWMHEPEAELCRMKGERPEDRRVIPAMERAAFSVTDVWLAMDYCAQACCRIAETEEFRNELERYKDWVSTGIFYKEIAVRADERSGGSKYVGMLSREDTKAEFKGGVFGCVYEDPRELGPSEFRVIFKNEFPLIWEWMKAMKAVKKSVLPTLMQMRESKDYLPIVEQLQSEGVTAVPMHDGIMVLEELSVGRIEKLKYDFCSASAKECGCRVEVKACYPVPTRNSESQECVSGGYDRQPPIQVIDRVYVADLAAIGSDHTCFSMTISGNTDSLSIWGSWGTKFDPLL